MSYQPVPSSEKRPSGPVQKDFKTDRHPGCLELICTWILTILVFLFVMLTFPISGWFVLKSVPKYERFVVFRLGRVIGSKGPGIILLLPFIDQWHKVDLRPKAFSIAPFKATCKDGALIYISAEIHYHIWNPILFVAVVEDADSTTTFTAQDVLMHFLLKKRLVKIQKDKNKIAAQLAFEINKKTKYWGLEVQRVDLTLHRVLKLPDQNLQRSSNIPPSTRLDRLPAPLRKLAVQILQRSSSPQSAHPSALSSESEESVQTTSDDAEIEEIESDVVSPDWLLSKVKLFLSEELVKQNGTCYLFSVNQKNGTQNLYYLDLSRGSGEAGYGMPERDPDVTLEVSEDTMHALFSGDLKPFSAYISGRIRVQGDLKLAMKLEDLIKKLNR
ncbi:stomatin-like protein 1 isoform X1 [Heterodontus francisci]|uniref:stomatin-like protein 1 isoform X1 n=1 Tax=Heterodontus francisci TaxID=7792 RepID=UPI00355C0E0F